MKTFACIATVPERLHSLLRAVRSLRPQVDGLHVYQNTDWGELPGDMGKFDRLGKVECEFYLSADDDLDYPPDYVEVMTQGAWEFDAVVTLHGRRFVNGARSYYRDAHQNYRCLGDVPESAFVDVPGTGVTCIPKRLHEPLAVEMARVRCPNAADLHLAVALRNLGERAVVLPHAADWLKYIPPPDDHTIYAEVINGDQTIQDQMLAEVLA